MTSTDVDTLRRAAKLAGFEFSVTDLEPLHHAVERALEALARLEKMPLQAVEPSAQFRVV